MSVALGTLRDSFDGVIPSIIATLDESGMPNVSYLSHVHYVDEGHVALSNQFFSKTSANVRRLGQATLLVVDGRDGRQHLLDIEFVRAFDSGPLFDRMAAQLDTLSALHGLENIMRLRSADLYRVRDCGAVQAATPLEDAPPPLPLRYDLPKALALSARIAAQDDSEDMLEVTLDGLQTDFGFTHAMILITQPDTNSLSAIAQRGYAPGGVGAEVVLKDGVIGMSAASRQPIRIADLRRARRYSSAVALSLRASVRQIPLPGLANPLSQMAAPMLSQGQLKGVIFVESDRPFAFRHEDEEVLMLIAQQLASSLHLAEYQEQPASAPSPQTEAVSPDGPQFCFRYYPYDGSVFIDDDYLIKGVPGRLLFAFVSAFDKDGKQDFTNREIRRDAALKLPDFKDNLETRLILLRRRLEEKGGPLRLSRPERGHIRLEVAARPRIEVVNEDQA